MTLIAERGILFPSDATHDCHEVTLLQRVSLMVLNLKKATPHIWRTTLRVSRLVGKFAYLKQLFCLQDPGPHTGTVFIDWEKNEIPLAGLDICLLDASMHTVPQWWRIKKPILGLGLTTIMVKSQDMVILEAMEWGSNTEPEMLKDHWADPYVDSMLENPDALR